MSKIDLNVTLLIDNSKSISASGRASLAEVVRSLRSFLLEEKSKRQGGLDIYISECMFSNTAQWNVVAKPIEIYNYSDPSGSDGASNIGMALKVLGDSIDNFNLQKNIVVIIGDGMVTDEPENQLRALNSKSAVAEWLMLAFVIGNLEKQYADKYAEIIKNVDHVFGIHEQDFCYNAIRGYIMSLFDAEKQQTASDPSTASKRDVEDMVVVDRTDENPKEKENSVPQKFDSWD